MELVALALCALKATTSVSGIQRSKLLRRKWLFDYLKQLTSLCVFSLAGVVALAGKLPPGRLCRSPSRCALLDSPPFVPSLQPAYLWMHSSAASRPNATSSSTVTPHRFSCRLASAWSCFCSSDHSSPDAVIPSTTVSADEGADVFSPAPMTSASQPKPKDSVIHRYGVMFPAWPLGGRVVAASGRAYGSR